MRQPVLEITTDLKVIKGFIITVKAGMKLLRNITTHGGLNPVVLKLGSNFTVMENK